MLTPSAICGAPARRQPLRDGVALTAICLVALMFGLEVSSVPIILPVLEQELGTRFQDSQWIMNAFTLACTTVLMAAGTLADRFGRRRMLTLCLVGFALASLACGLATSSAALIAARFVQGLGAGAMLICQFAILSHQFREPVARARAFAIWGVVSGVGLGFGPLVGSLILTVADWRWVFLVHVPLSALTLVMLRFSVPESRNPVAHRLDLAGMATMTLTVFALVYFITQGAEIGFGNPAALGWLAVSLIGLVWFVRVERRSAHPMFDFSVFRIHRFNGAMMGSIGMNFSFWPFMIYLPIYFQTGLGFDTIATGCALLAYTLPTLLVPPLAERLVLRRGAERVIPMGMLLLAAGFLLMAAGNASANMTQFIVLAGCLVAGIGLGLTNSPVTNTSTGAVSAERSGMASGIDFSARLITLAINIALMGFVLLHGATQHLAAALPHATPAQIATAAQDVAAGKLPTLAGSELARAALRDGVGGAMLYAGAGALLLAVASFLFFRRGQQAKAAGTRGAMPTSPGA